MIGQSEWLKFDTMDLWNKKYRHDNEDFETFIKRISASDKDIMDLILHHKFLPGGRILASRAVTDRKVTYSNCYVIAPPEDNIESIFECAKKLARTYSYGGGCGIDLSRLRPHNARVSNASKTSSGPVSFMEMFSQVTGTISQNGRRGALMVSMDVNHPDIEEFIDCKTDLSKVNYANISVRVNDKFMQAVINNEDYILTWPCNLQDPALNSIVDTLEYEELTEVKTSHDEVAYVRKIKAKELFDKLAANNWQYAEPGILYWDQITQYNMLHNNPEFEYAGTNPCGEEPLPAGGSCLLGAINLSAYVVQGAGIFDFLNLELDVKKVVRYLNGVLDEGLPLHPLKEQRDSVDAWRQIGLGTMGLADTLIKVHFRYGSEASIQFLDKVFHTIALAAVSASLELAKEKGCYKKCDKEKLAKSSFIKAVTEKKPALLAEIRKYGLRNSQLLTCAPTGSIANLIGVSTGVEPIYALEYDRVTKSIEEDGKEKVYHIVTPFVQEWRNNNPGKPLPDYFVDSSTISVLDRVKVQATLQKWIDASISSTVNLKEETSIDGVKNLYIEAWKHKLKGITVYRDGCKRTGILSTSNTKKPDGEVEFDSITPISRKTMPRTFGSTFCKKCSCGTLYITINKDDKGNIVESFVHTSKGGICQANTNGLNRMVSLALRSGVKVDEIIDQLQGIHCPACQVTRAKGNEISGLSCPDILARTLREFKEESQNMTPVHTEEHRTLSGDVCPNCGSPMKMEGGCDTCLNCGYSHCGG